jgi:hypothetical protein
VTPLHPFAWSLAKRASVATDETTSTAGMRVARLAALAPLLACLSVLAVCGHARLRGEIGALEALGMPPWDAARGAALAGWAFGGVALVVLALPWVDPGSLFPRFAPPIDWVMDATGRAARSRAATVFADGTIEIGSRAVAGGTQSPARWAALACLSPMAACVPAWAVTPMRTAVRLATLLASAALLIVVLHLVASGRVGAWLGPIASVPLWAALFDARFIRPRASS